MTAHQISLEPSKFIIYSNARWKIIWDISVMILLIIVCLIVPYRIAFTQEETTGWLTVYYLTDLIFAVDLIMNFFTTFTDEKQMREITDHSVIAKKYLKSWFVIDILSVVPIDLFLSNELLEGNQLLRVLRIGKLYKMMRLFRMVRALKLLKNQVFMEHMSEKLRINQGTERLLSFGFFLALFVHVSACFMIILGNLTQQFDFPSFVDDLDPDAKPFSSYVTAVYFVCTTITTVGYGDYSPRNGVERIFGVILMITGISAFGFMSGALASILSSYDSSSAEQMERLLLLNKCNDQYDIPKDLYSEIRNSIKMADANQELEERERFLNYLPPVQRMEMMMHFHEKEFSKYPLFKKVGDRALISWIAGNSKHKVLCQGEMVYTEGDDIELFYFMQKGIATFTFPRFDNMPFGLIDPEKHINLPDVKLPELQFFGLEDSVYNHIKLNKLNDNSDGIQFHDLSKALRKRKF